MADKNGEGRGKANLLPDRLGAKRYVLNAIKQSAKKRGLLYELVEKDAISLITKECHYCGRPPSSVMSKGSTHLGPFYYNGLDRKDNTKGYLLDNVITCCYHCNIAKSTLSYQDFLEMIKSIYHKLILPYDNK